MPFGVGTPATAEAPPTKAPVNAAFIDYRTRDYVIDAEGAIARMPITRQRVLLALSTLLGSSSVQPEAGLALPRRIDESYPQRAKAAILQALAFLVPNDIAISSDDIEVDTTSIVGRVQIAVSYVDLHTGQPDQVTTSG